VPGKIEEVDLVALGERTRDAGPAGEGIAEAVQEQHGRGSGAAAHGEPERS